MHLLFQFRVRCLHLGEKNNEKRSHAPKRNVGQKSVFFCQKGETFFCDELTGRRGRVWQWQINLKSHLNQEIQNLTVNYQPSCFVWATFSILISILFNIVILSRLGVWKIYFKGKEWRSWKGTAEIYFRNPPFHSFTSMCLQVHK